MSITENIIKFAPIVLWVIIAYIIVKSLLWLVFYRKWSSYKLYLKTQLFIVLFMIMFIVLWLLEIKIALYFYEDMWKEKLSWWILDNYPQIHSILWMLVWVMYLILLLWWITYMICYYTENKQKMIKKEIWEVKDISGWFDFILLVTLVIWWRILWKMYIQYLSI